MKTLLLVLLVLGIAVPGIWLLSGCSSPTTAVEAGASDLEMAVFSVEGMTCSGCEVGVEAALKRLDGINKVDASYGKGEARVSYDPSKAQPEQIQKAIEKIGYRAKLLPKEVKD